MTPPKVSVLTTVFNRQDYLAECIESVLASSFTDFEYIIVDDQSTDASYQVALDYAKQDSRITVYRNKINLGDYPNRNIAASYASGTYLKYVDSDDIIYPHGLEVMVRCMELFPEAGYGLGARAPMRARPYPVQLSPRDAYLSHYNKEHPIFVSSPLSAIIRRHIFESVGYFPTARMTSDSGMWHKISLSYPVLLMPQGLVWYREHGAQEVSDIQSKRVYYRLLYDHVALDALGQAPIHGVLSDAEAQLFKKHIRIAQKRNALKLFIKGQFSAAFNMTFQPPN